MEEKIYCWDCKKEITGEKFVFHGGYLCRSCNDIRFGWIYKIVRVWY